jgi:membrane associated rhomboid family serine protease
MGIENRDWYRATGYSGDWTLESAPACKYLIIATVVVFVLQIFLVRPPTPDELRKTWRDEVPWAGEVEPGDEGPEIPEEMLRSLPDTMQVSVVQEWLQLQTDKVLYRGQVWRLVTCAFCHDRFGVWHILVNMLFLYWFGRTLEPMYGSREFLYFYLTAAVVASLSYVGLDLALHQSTPAIGASGAVMAVVMLYAIHFPRERLYVFMFLPIEIRWLVAIYLIYDLHPILLALAGTGIPDGVAHAAHVGGLAFGFIYWRYGLRLDDFFSRVGNRRWLRRLGSRRRIRLYRPPREPAGDLDTLVDTILDKVRDEGRESLTDVEREVLRIAGERYRNRSN